MDFRSVFRTDNLKAAIAGNLQDKVYTLEEVKRFLIGEKLEDLAGATEVMDSEDGREKPLLQVLCMMDSDDYQPNSESLEWLLENVVHSATAIDDAINVINEEIKKLAPFSICRGEKNVRGRLPVNMPKLIGLEDILDLLTKYFDKVTEEEDELKLLSVSCLSLKL